MGENDAGACFVFQYSGDRELYCQLEKSVCDLLSVQQENGKISTYSRTAEFGGWDLWCRKYILLGLQYFLEICEDEALKAKIVEVMCAHTDYIIAHIGNPEEGKLQITDAADHWEGLNSSSILEPIVRLYSITKRETYLAFAYYTVENGGISSGNLFELA